MKKTSVLLALLAAGSLLSLRSLGYDKPYKMGQGRYLTAEQKQALHSDILNNASEEFKEAFFQNLGMITMNRVASRKEVNLAVIEFRQTTEQFFRVSSDATVYLLCLDFREAVPEDLDVERQRKKKELYEIWTISGFFVLFEKSVKDGTYRFVKAGAAE